MLGTRVEPAPNSEYAPIRELRLITITCDYGSFSGAAQAYENFAGATYNCQLQLQVNRSSMRGFLDLVFLCFPPPVFALAIS